AELSKHGGCIAGKRRAALPDKLAVSFMVGHQGLVLGSAGTGDHQISQHQGRTALTPLGLRGFIDVMFFEQIVLPEESARGSLEGTEQAGGSQGENVSPGDCRSGSRSVAGQRRDITAVVGMDPARPARRN